MQSNVQSAGTDQSRMRLLSSLLGPGLALDILKHQAVVTVILTDSGNLGTEQDRDSDLIYLSEVALT